MPANSPIRFALVGCGRVATRHAAALSGCGDGEWVAVCDIEPDRRNAWAQELGVPGFERFEDMLDAVHANVVVLATPSGLHPGQAIRAARAGLHVVTEKPMATRWGDGRKMVETVEACGKHLFVVKQHRFNPAVRRLERAIRTNRLGRVYAVQLNILWTRPQSYYDLAPWRGTWELDGGALMNQAIHYVDLLQWLFGPVESVQAFTGTLSRRIEVEDTATVALRWRSGALGSLMVTMLAHDKNFEGSMTVLAEHGTVRLGGLACDQVQAWTLEHHPDDDETNHEPFSDVYGNGHRPFYENVIQTLRGDAEPMVCGREGLKSLEIVVAAYQSAQESRRVSLPLDL